MTSGVKVSVNPEAASPARFASLERCVILGTNSLWRKFSDGHFAAVAKCPLRRRSQLRPTVCTHIGQEESLGGPSGQPTMEVDMRRLMVVLLAAIILALELSPGNAFALTISGPFNFRDNRGPNPVGFTRGDTLVFGATSIIPSGSPTTATATQGTTTLSVPFDPFTIFPDEYDTIIPFNASLPNGVVVNHGDTRSRDGGSGPDQPDPQSSASSPRTEPPRGRQEPNADSRVESARPHRVRR